MERKVYKAEGVSASGPYSHVVDGGNYIFFSGQTAMNSLGEEGKALKGNVAEQTKEVFSNLNAAMKAAGVENNQIVKVNVYLTTMDDFNPMNEVYKEFFEAPYPARTCVAVHELPLGAEVEIEMIARK